MLPSELLEKNDWCRNLMAANKDGKPINVKSKKACKFCILGAMTRTKKLHYMEKVRLAIKEKCQRHISIATYNDEFAESKEEVIKLLKSVGL